MPTWHSPDRKRLALEDPLSVCKEVIAVIVAGRVEVKLLARVGDVALNLGIQMLLTTTTALRAKIAKSLGSLIFNGALFWMF